MAYGPFVWQGRLGFLLAYRFIADAGASFDQDRGALGESAVIKSRPQIGDPRAHVVYWFILSEI
jgi:hypothetical protein